MTRTRITLAAIAATLVAGAMLADRTTAQSKPAAQPQSPAPAAAPKGDSALPKDLQQELAMFRSDMNAAKIRVVNQSLKMTPDEAQKFWPIYQKYEKELAKVDDQRIALIRQFLILHETGKLNDQAAAELIPKWLDITQARLDLWKKYSKEIGSALSPIRAAQFLQIEHQISLLVDINIASEMPAVKEEPNK